ncbi:cytochrome c3 family protein [Luteirhabdus pelagi]|uniref:cytochrome c3 family protein n=1 Tax=Luteirhabdus pelagi TaxID=2792783 RepID=UPI00193A09EC|nr:cytochrome c3 family protein [Luteirhabdus pelagi]
MILLGQISPGDLTQAHSQLEGISNCTECHVLGERVSDQKCLACHTEIQTLLRRDEGYHANSSVRNQNCFECHSEHHGRKFDMIRFDENNFDHTLAGYELEGAHASVDCRECHKPSNIQNSELRKREDTFLGLDTKCLSCHDDYHQETLTNDCMSCHTMEAWSPAPKFDHSTSNFPLRGEHINVDCKECHQETTRNGEPFTLFEGIAFEDCKACHDDVHNGQLPGTCASCHTETSFSTFAGRGSFNHAVTGFTLKGSHKNIDCFSCHKTVSSPTSVFQDNINIEETSCISCHEDQHDGKYGTNCNKCHQESSFLALRDMDFFDHSTTDYPLEGQHVGVDCRECHAERFSNPIDFSACMNCHEDYHNGEFAENGVSPDCKECHSLEKGFEYTLFTLEDHQKSDFPLEGAHIATPCFACHVDEGEERWSFANLGNDCIDCHTDFHEGYLASEFYPQQDCEACHISDTWAAVSFDHTRTDWPLTGAHQTVNCRECHFEIDNEKTVISQNFSNLNTDCTTCHENVHGDDFAVNGVTDCMRCHVTNSWMPEKFDHSNTRFPLEGKHASLTCNACHAIESATGETEIVYQLNKLECTDCHL